MKKMLRWALLLSACFLACTARAASGEATCSYYPDQPHGGEFTYPIFPCEGVEWDPVEGATHYEVWAKMCTWVFNICDPANRRDGSEWILVHMTNATYSDFADHGDYPWGYARRKYLRVKACNDGGCSRMGRDRIWFRGVW